MHDAAAMLRVGWALDRIDAGNGWKWLYDAALRSHTDPDGLATGRIGFVLRGEWRDRSS